MASIGRDGSGIEIAPIPVWRKDSRLLYLCAFDEPHGYEEGAYLADIKPYLRPLSSMTQEEKEYISERCGFSIAGPIRNECELIMPVLAADWLIDFYNEHHFDYRGLIEKGLALEADELLYKDY